MMQNKTSILSIFLTLGLFLAPPPVWAQDPTVNCSEKSGPLSVDDSPTKKQFEDILKNPDKYGFYDLLRLWYPQKQGSTQETYFFKCQRTPWSGLSYTPGSFLSDQCTPDVVYSWGPLAKLQNIQANAPDGAEWSGLLNPTPAAIRSNFPVVYATLSPVATYQYGLIPIRMKLKSDVKIMGVKDLKVRRHEMSYYDWGGNDFFISHGIALDNWSFGTAEHYDEIVRDIRNFITSDKGIAYDTKNPTGRGIDRIFNVKAWDGNTPGEQVLRRSLLEMIRMILKKEGRIYYQKDSCRNREIVFRTTKPSYINPFKAGEKLPDLDLITVVEASYGLNDDAKNQGNATKAAAGYCDLREKCPYKVRARNFGVDYDAKAQRAFDISWRCGDDPKVYTHKVDAPADHKIFDLTCP